MNKVPKVTVLIPVFNGEKYLKECLDSILTQTFTDLECLLIDDGSTDGSEAVIKSFADPRVRYVKNEKNLGIANTRNKGFDLARGEYVAFIDCDDVSVPDRLEKQVAFMEAHPEAGICGGFMQSMEADGTLIQNAIWDGPTDYEATAADLAVSCTLWNPTLITRKSVVLDNALYHNPDYVAGSDLDWYTRMAKVTKLANLPEILTYYRKHSAQITTHRKFVSRRNSNNLHLGLVLEEVKRLQPGLTGEVKPVTRDMTEVTFLENLVLVDQVMARVSEATARLPRYDRLKKHLIHMWLDTLFFLPRHTPDTYRVIKQSPFYKTLPLKARLSIWGKSMLGLDRSFTKKIFTLISPRKQVA